MDNMTLKEMINEGLSDGYIKLIQSSKDEHCVECLIGDFYFELANKEDNKLWVSDIYKKYDQPRLAELIYNKLLEKKNNEETKDEYKYYETYLSKTYKELEEKRKKEKTIYILIEIDGTNISTIPFNSKAEAIDEMKKQYEKATPPITAVRSRYERLSSHINDNEAKLCHQGKELIWKIKECTF